MAELSKTEAAKFVGCSTKTLDRMVLKGELNPVKKDGKVFFPKKQLKLIMAKVMERQEKHVPKLAQEQEPEEPISPRELIFHMEEKPEDLLNEIGRGEVLRVTKMLRSAGLLDSTDQMIIMKYALCQQMYFKYLAASDSKENLLLVAVGDKPPAFFKMMESYQRQVQFYEKELGLTTASRLKMRTPEPDEEEDEMEKILNG